MEPRSTHTLESHLSGLPRAPLMPFDANGRMAAAIPFAFDDYLELVDTNGRVIREGKHGYLPGETPQILERLNIDPEQFIATAVPMLDLFESNLRHPDRATRSRTIWVSRHRRKRSGRRFAASRVADAATIACCSTTASQKSGSAAGNSSH